jgi:arylformamidase
MDHLREFKHYDISPVISARTAVFPGDQPFENPVAMSFKKGDHLALSAVHSTVHLGAHADAPSHYHRDGVSIEKRDLHYYLGDAQVVTVRLPRGKRISPKDIAGVKITAPRVLFKTGSFPDSDRWNGDFNSLSPELIETLAAQKVILTGIDTPSIDPADSKGLESHQAIFRANMAILEGVVLDHVPDGVYTLVALPLRIEAADASPVRAILISNSDM